jgi:hypothetical protein
MNEGLFEHAMQWQFDRIATIGHGITPDDVTESFTDIRTGHSADMRSLQKRIDELDGQLRAANKRLFQPDEERMEKVDPQPLNVGTPIHIKGLDFINSDNVQIVVEEHYECPECGATLNRTEM